MHLARMRSKMAENGVGYFTPKKVTWQKRTAARQL